MLPDPARNNFVRWIIDHVLWDRTGAPSYGLPKELWAARKLLVAVAGSAVLTWFEWIKHHPPEIMLVAVIHFVFVLAATAAGVALRRWFGFKRRRG